MKEVEPYKYRIYNPIKEGEFAAKAKEILNRKTSLEKKTKIEYKKKIIHKVLKTAPSTTRNVESRPLLLTSLDKPITYTFSKSNRKSTFEEFKDVNKNRFEFNPRDAQPDPYYLTHKKY